MTVFDASAWLALQGDTRVSMIVLAVGAVVLVVILGAVLAHRAEKRLRAAFAHWANAGGWSYFPDERPAPDLPFDLFDRGHSRRTTHVVTKSLPDGIPGLADPVVRIFHYHYAETSGSGKDRRTTHYNFRCVHARTGVRLGAVTIRTEGFFDKIAQAIGFDDIDLEDPEFSKRFCVKARVKKDAYDLLGPELMDFLVGQSRTIETGDDHLLVIESGRPVVAEYARLCEFASGFLARLPRRIVNEARERAGLAPVLDAGAAALHHRAGRGGESPQT